VSAALQRVLAWHSVTFRKTHNLDPGEGESPSAEEAAEALAIAREVHEALLARLPPEVRP